MSLAPSHAGSLQQSDLDQAHQARRVLAHLLEQDRAVSVRAAGAGLGEDTILPEVAARLLLDVLGQLGEGNAVAVLPLRAELSTQQAADMLAVSRPFLIGLLEKGALPFRRVGTHRRVRLDDLIAFRTGEQAARHQALDELVRQGQELGLGY